MASVATKTRRKRFRGWFRDRIEFPVVALVLRVAAWVLPLLPYWAVDGLARLCGTICWWVPRVRRLVTTNVALALPEVDAARVARQSLVSMAATFLETFWVGNRPERLAAVVDLNGADECLAALAKESGCVFLSPHLGNWEVGHQRLSLAGVPASCVAREQRNPGIERLFYRLRTSYDGAVIHQKGAMRGILSAVREGRVVEMLIDQTTSSRKGGVFVPFFGLPALTSRSPAVLLRRANVRIVIGCLRREGGGRFAGRFVELPAKTGSYDSDEALLGTINAQMEALIRESPEQYLWLYRKWRVIPRSADEALRNRYPYYAKPERPPTRKQSE